ncbi:hypothetical protein DXG03_004051 [Asterophora parasitica]|uniref:Uncharacterized protein n=1 Tax=Asterophora parasitica TaxID=117018 RepID=A0A9P7GF78_9AGAR|nr:hypothetical protein DXG03_004051 [Asterophora parasitica]
MDSARFKAAIAMFPMFFRAGGWIALAATHYNFVREIPMLANYEVRLTIGPWDQKWIYVIAKFVTKPKSKSKKSDKPSEQPASVASSSDNENSLFNASLRTPADIISTTGSPIPPSETPTSIQQADTSRSLKAVAASLAAEPEADGATLHTIVVSQCCFKMGRITVPPALVLAINGFSVPSTNASAAPYSRTNPPPHWARAKAVMSRPRGGSTRALQNLLKGGWRDVPLEDRWWDRAMGGSVEERRKQRLEVVQALGLGMSGVRNL